jgi:hypothetical protein
LGYNGNLEVDDHVQLIIVVEDRLARLVSEMYTELVLEEVSVDNDSNQSDAEKSGSQHEYYQKVKISTYVDAVK